MIGEAVVNGIDDDNFGTLGGSGFIKKNEFNNICKKLGSDQQSPTMNISRSYRIQVLLPIRKLDQSMEGLDSKCFVTLNPCKHWIGDNG